MDRLNRRLGRNVYWSLLLFAIISVTLFSGTVFCEEVILTQAEKDFALARDLRNCSKIAEANAVYLSIADSSPGTEIAMKSLARAGRCQMQLGNLAGAGQLYERLINDYSTQSNFYESVFYFAGSYWNAGKYDEAKDVYQIVYDNSTDSNLILKALGGIARTNCKKGEYEKVITLCDNVLAGETDNSLPFYGHVLVLKAKCFIDMGANEQAEAIQQQIDLHSDKEYYPAMQLDIAYSYRQNDKFEKAIAVYDKTIENTTDQGKQVEAFAGIAASLARLNDDPGVIASVDSLCEDFAGHEKLGWAVFVIGEEYQIRAHTADGKSQEQKNALHRKAISVWKKNIKEINDQEYKCLAYYFTGLSYWSLKDYRRSLLYFHKVINEFPEDKHAASALFMIGRIYHKKPNARLLVAEPLTVSTDIGDPNKEPGSRIASLRLYQSNAPTIMASASIVSLKADAVTIKTARAAFELLVEKYPDSSSGVYASQWLNRNSSK